MRTILVVDDTEANRQILTLRLARAGFATATASNGAEALETARANPPALIVMDMDMPVMDGFEATRNLKSHPATATIPVISLTANADPQIAEKCLSAGCDAYEPKPLDFPRLLEKINSLLAS
jgi:CheY-like chemotaxis protein